MINIAQSLAVLIVLATIVIVITFIFIEMGQRTKIIRNVHKYTSLFLLLLFTSSVTHDKFFN